MKKSLTKIILGVVCFSLPANLFASIKINEIAWMGTDASYTDEWIELFNDSNEEVDISDWVLGWKSGDISIKFGSDKKCLNTKISPSGFYILERTDDNSIPDITADCIYTGDLSNDGEVLVLKDTSGIETDRVDGSKKNKPWEINNDGQTVGRNEKPKLTAQRTISGFWITATGTPNSPNSEQDISVSEETPSVELDTESTTITTQTPSFSTYSAHSSSVEISNINIKPKLSLFSGRDRNVLVGFPVHFGAFFKDDSGKMTYGGNFNWSFGDGRQASGERIEYKYQNQGEYVVILNAFINGEEYVGRSFIKAFHPHFSISVGDNGSLGIKNELPFEVNLRGLKITNGVNNFVFNADTIIIPNKTLYFSESLLGFGIREGDKIELLSADGKIVTSFKHVLPKNNLSETEKEKEQEPEINLFENPKPVSVEDAEILKAELISLEGKLREISDEYLKSVSVASTDNQVISEDKEDVKEDKGLEMQITTEANNNPTTTKIVLFERPKKETGFWSFFKGLFSIF